MNKLLTLLLERDKEGQSKLSPAHWWWLHETTGDDPGTERTSMFTYPEVMRVIINKLRRIGAEHEPATQPATDTLPPHDHQGTPVP